MSYVICILPLLWFLSKINSLEIRNKIAIFSFKANNYLGARGKLKKVFRKKENLLTWDMIPPTSFIEDLGVSNAILLGGVNSGQTSTKCCDLAG